jgi:FkbM family methyltransferase
MIKSLAKRLLASRGYEVRRKAAPAAAEAWSRQSWRGACEQVRKLGWRPQTVIDVGAAAGDFTRECHKIFPDARYLLVEPLQERQALLEATTAQVPNSAYALVAAGAADGFTTLHVHNDLYGSSIYREAEGALLDGLERRVPVRSLDDLCRESGLPGPYLLKLDVQGGELDALSGASGILAQTDYVILEATLFQVFLGGPQLHDVVAFMRERGFVVYDVLGCLYRPLDGALSQVDLAFVQEAGLFRQDHRYATPEQRAAQDEMFDQLEQVARRRAGRSA